MSLLFVTAKKSLATLFMFLLMTIYLSKTAV